MKWARAVLATCATTAAALTAAPVADADAVPYLVNVTVRPGYNFPNADSALRYGHGICDMIRQGVPFGTLVSDIKRDCRTVDHYQGTYLIAQSAQELCPAQIWQVRNSAAGWTGSP